MNTLMIALMYIAPQPFLNCDDTSARGEHFVPIARTPPAVAPAKARPVASGDVLVVPITADRAGTRDSSNNTDLLFYLDSPAQAVSDSVATRLSPWVQLRPVAATDGVTTSTAPKTEAVEKPVVRHGHRPGNGNFNACS